MRQKNNIPPDAEHFLRTEIDSTDFKKEYLPRKIWTKKTEKTIFFQKKYSERSGNRRNHQTI